MNANIYTVFYINRNGNTATKQFGNVEKALAFCRILDERIKRGTCGGYDLCNW